jgi:hypothetical protein
MAASPEGVEDAGAGGARRMVDGTVLPRRGPAVVDDDWLADACGQGELATSKPLTSGGERLR